MIYGITHSLEPKGGLWDPPEENHFPSGILWWILHYIFYTKNKDHLQVKKIRKKIYRFKMAAKLPIFASCISILAKIWKTTFPLEFSMKFGS